jgi:hypothetical protein
VADHDLLLRRLLAADSAAQLEKLVAANLDEVLTAFPSWTTVPEPIRADRRAIERYGHKLVQVAELLNARGHPGPLKALEGDPEDDPVHRWNETFAKAQALADADRPAASAKVFRWLLSELDRASGWAVNDMRSLVLGALGAVSWQAGDVGQAFHWTKRALEACVANDDSYGIAAYRENLQVYEALWLPKVNPKAGARLLECRRLIAAAQSASDRFDYDGSNRSLDDALAIVSQGGERLRASFAGKIYGLRGWNHYYLGNVSDARADTERALAECSATADPNGVRIYTANREFLSHADGDQAAKLAASSTGTQRARGWFSRRRRPSQRSTRSTSP